MAVSEGSGGDDDGHDSEATLFVTNVLNGTVAGNGSIVNQGTVVRIKLHVSSTYAPTVGSLQVIGSGFSERTDPPALVIGPTGLAMSTSGDTLYVADTLNNRIAAIDDPLTRHFSGGTGKTLTAGGTLNFPLGLTLDGNGDIFTVNGGDGYLVETDRHGNQIFKTLVDNTGNPPGAEALFGLIDVPVLSIAARSLRSL